MPIDRGAIDAQLREIGEGDRWWEVREFRDLPHILHADERILGLTPGRVSRRPPSLRAGRGWLAVATSDRLILLKQERFARRQIEIPGGQISRIDQRGLLRSHQITVTSSGRRIRLRIPRENARRFNTAIGQLLPANPQHQLPADLEPIAWIPGVATVASLPGFAGIVSRVMMLSPPDPPAPDRLARLEATVEQLQSEIERLSQQVSFLEDLLQQRLEGSYLPGAPDT